MRTLDFFTWLWFTFMPKWVVLRKDVFSFGENKYSNVKFTSFVNLCKLKFYFSLPPRVFKFFIFIFILGWLSLILVFGLVVLIKVEWWRWNYSRMINLKSYVIQNPILFNKFTRFPALSLCNILSLSLSLSHTHTHTHTHTCFYWYNGWKNEIRIDILCENRPTLSVWQNISMKLESV